MRLDAEDERLYPAFLRVAGRRCLVVGGGAVAARKVAKLAAAGAVVEVVSPALHEALRRQLGDNIVWTSRQYQSADVEGAWLVVAATDDPAVNAQVRRDAEAQRQFVNVIDARDACTWMVPAVVDAAGITIAISTHGHAPARAKRLRELLEADLEDGGNRFVTAMRAGSSDRPSPEE